MVLAECGALFVFVPPRPTSVGARVGLHLLSFADVQDTVCARKCRGWQLAPGCVVNRSGVGLAPILSGCAGRPALAEAHLGMWPSLRGHVGALGTVPPLCNSARSGAEAWEWRPISCAPGHWGQSHVAAARTSHCGFALDPGGGNRASACHGTGCGTPAWLLFARTSQLCML